MKCDAEESADAANYPHLKIKLDNDRPIEKLEAIRAARPDAKLIIDVNQGWNFAELSEYAPLNSYFLSDLRVV